MHRNYNLKLPLLIFLITITSVNYSFSQTPLSSSKYYNENLKKADENFYLLNYNEAIALYKEALRKKQDDTIVICKIANSYRLMNKTDEAENWYKKVITGISDSIDPDYLLQFAQTLLCNSKHQEALYWYKKYSSLRPLDNRAIEAINSLENLSGLYRDSIYYEVNYLPINTENSELGPRYYKDGIIFLSDRGDNKRKLISRYLFKNNPVETHEPIAFISGVKAEFNEGVMSFYKNNSKVIYSQNYLPDTVDRRKVKSVPFKLFFGRFRFFGLEKYLFSSISENGLYIFTTMHYRKW
ncbi:MAG: tetratricopeptide repeat protein [Bacteroidales bacterium]|nr:tetratricopeptide repeat protein [Bacteroidales bacterium]